MGMRDLAAVISPNPAAPGADSAAPSIGGLELGDLKFAAYDFLLRAARCRTRRRGAGAHDLTAGDSPNPLRLNAIREARFRTGSTWPEIALRRARPTSPA